MVGLMLDSGFVDGWIGGLVDGWILDTGCSRLDAGCWILTGGFSILVSGYWMEDETLCVLRVPCSVNIRRQGCGGRTGRVHREPGTRVQGRDREGNSLRGQRRGFAV